MLRYLLLSLFLVTAASTTAQPFTFDEAIRGGGSSSDTGEGIALAPDGSRTVVGTFEGTATFGEVSVTSAGDSDFFLVRYDAEGEAVWARRGGTDVFNDFGTATAIAPDGSIYATGYFTGIATFDGGSNPDASLTTFSDFDVFLVKYDAAGDLEWVRQGGGTEQDTGRDLAIDADGNVYLVGGFAGTATFGGVTLTSAGSSDAFLAKYAPDGTVLWARRGGSDQADLAYGVAVTADGAAHLSGSFRGVAQFGSLPIQSAGSSDVFIVQYDTDGAPVWVEGIGADGSEFTRGGGIGLGPGGDVYVQGSFSNTILVGSDVLVSTGFTDIFVAKLDSEGNEVWGRRGGGDGTNFSAALAVDASGNALAVGYTDGTGTFDDTPITTQGRDGYVAVFDAEGDLVTVELLGGTGQDATSGVAVSDAVGRFAATGSFRDTATFGDLDLTSVGSNDVFVLGGPTGAPPPTPSVLFVDADATGAETGLSWDDAFTDLQDALTLAATIDADSLAIWVAEGIYYPTDDGDRTVSFELQSGLTLYGGFDGTETALDQRDPSTNETILSGDIGTPDDRSDNSHHVVTAFNVDEMGALDGFTVRNAFSVGAPLPNGGGILSLQSAATFQHLVVTENRGGLGGGMYTEEGTELLYDVEFLRNIAFGHEGGGMAIETGAPSLVNVRFLGNYAGAVGGALSVGPEGQPLLINSAHIGNSAGGAGGAISTSGDLILINSTISANQADHQSGGLEIFGGSTILRNSIVWRNSLADITLIGEGFLAADRTVIDGGCPSEATCSFIIADPPRFLREPEPGPDGEWGTEDDDYGDLRLQEGSPAIDFGLADFLPPDTFDLDEDGDTEEPLPMDLDGNPRVQGNEVDLGAYESPFTAVSLESGTGTPTENALGAAYPNPFWQQTTLALDVAEAQDVTVEVFDVLGRRVATVHDGPLAVGAHRIVIEAAGLPAGVYVVRAEGEAFRFAQRVTLVR